MLNRIAKKIDQYWMAHFPERAHKLERLEPVVSFTFDDFPRTAWTIGGRILEDAGFRATYFVSAAFSPERMHVEMPFGMLEGTNFYEMEDLCELREHDHEIGSHGFRHVRVPSQTRFDVEQSVIKNAEFLRNAIGSDLSLRSFAYPQGAVSPRTRKLLSQHFSSCRGTRRGINSGLIDLALLQAVVVDNQFDPKCELPALIEQVKRGKGWLIFCAHDIQEKPSRWGCTPDVFEEIVRQVRLARIEVAKIEQIAP